MVDWWNHLTLTQQVFAVFGIVGTAILILQTVLLLFGLGHDGMDSDADADIDADLAALYRPRFRSLFQHQWMAWRLPVEHIRPLLCRHPSRHSRRFRRHDLCGVGF